MNMRSVSLALPAALLLLLLSAFIALRTAAAPAIRTSEERNGPPLAPAQQLGLTVDATVGLNPNACAKTDRIRVAPGTRVFYCYRAVNTGQVTLTVHTLQDSQAGVIWDRQKHVLPPGSSLTTLDAGLKLGNSVQRNTRIDVVWTASAVTPTLTTSATASVRVNVVQPSAAVTKTVGPGLGGCPAGTQAVVPSREHVAFCVVVVNTGNAPLTRHTLADPALGITATFGYTLAPSERLTITNAALAELGIDGALVRRNLTETLVNTLVYTAVSAPDYAATGGMTVSDVATATVSMAQAGVRLTATVGTDPAVCSNTTSLSLTDPNTQLYYCAILHNTGNVTITRHILAQPRLNLVSEFSRPLAPGKVVSVTNALLETMGQQPALGPLTVYNGANLALDNTMVYTGTGSLTVTKNGSTRTYTATASASAFAGVQTTPTPTPTATHTPQSFNLPPTNTPWPTPTPTWTWTPTPTPLADAQQFPTNTPTPTHSYAISLLTTPTSPAFSPLATPEPPVDAAATQEAQATIAALDATATAAAVSPLATPTPFPTVTPSSTVTVTPTGTPAAPPTALPAATDTPAPQVAATATLSPTVAALVVVVTNTPDAALAQRPIVYPTPTPTPDYLLAAARAIDAFMLTTAWVWFLFGVLVFFVVAGVLAGLSFRQNERRRYDLSLLDDADLLLDDDLLTPPPIYDEELDDWPDSLP